MKLTMAIIAALGTLLYAIVKAFVPDFPITEAEIVRIIILALLAFGVTVSEEQIRAWAVRRGLHGFMRKEDQ